MHLSSGHRILDGCQFSCFTSGFSFWFNNQIADGNSFTDSTSAQEIPSVPMVMTVSEFTKGL